MKRITQVTLLLYLAIVIHSAPLRLDETNNSSRSSSISEDSEEEKYSSHPAKSFRTSSTTIVPNQDNPPNAQKRDTLQYSEHQIAEITSSQLPNHSLQDATRDQYKNRKVENDENESPPLASSPPSTQESENQSQNRNLPTNLQDRDTAHQQIPSTVTASNSTIEANSSPGRWNTQTTPTVGSFNRRVRDTYDQQTPSKATAGRSSNDNQARDIDDQKTFKEYLPSSATERPGEVPVVSRNIHSSADGNDNRQVRDADNEEITTTSTRTTESDGTATTIAPTEDDAKKPEENIDTTELAVSSTIIPGDVYAENRKAQTEISQLIRNTDEHQITPKVIISDPSGIISTENPQINRGILPSLLESSSAETSKILSEHQDLHASGSDYQARFKLEQEISTDGNYDDSSPKPQEDVKNVDNIQRTLREVSTEKKKSTEEPDLVRVVKLTGTPTYPRSHQ